MASFNDFINEQSGWIHELAKAEIHPDAEKLLQLGKSFDPRQLVEESTIDFLTDLRECFENYARVFNGYSEQGEKFQQVKVYQIAQAVADFMVFRKQIKLMVTNVSHGTIQINFAKHVSGAVAVNGHQQDSVNEDGSPFIGQAQELIARVGPFRDIYWTFQNEKVTADQVAKFYFAEFVRATRTTQRSKLGNELLLEQIKSLLQEKGLDL